MRWNKIFLVWDGNHCLQAWLPYVNMVHWKDPAWHISMDAIVLDTIVGFVELFKVMAYLNN
jgi:hypothetical protein